MCPSVPKTSEEAIARAARKIVEREGAEALSMQAIARLVGVRAPSLYKRFADRDAILVAVTEGVLLDLRAALVAAAPGKSPAGDLAEMARAYRAFARRFPRLYPLLFASGADVDARAAAVEPVLARLSALVAPKRVLPAARLLTAFLHGFVSMELGGAFRLGGSVDEAFAFGLETILGALVSSAR